MMAVGNKTSEIALFCGLFLLGASISIASASVTIGQRPPIVRPTPTPTPRPQTGSLFVTSQKGVRVVITRIPKGTPIEKIILDERQPANFNSLPPGSYAVSATLEGYKTRKETINIPVNRTIPLPFNLEQITYAALIQTNIDSGEIIYNQEGEIEKRIPISDRRATLPNLPPGKYLVTVKPTGMIYQDQKESIVVDKDHISFKIEVTRKVSTTEINEPWINLDDWDAPPGWQAVEAKLSVSGEGILLPRDDGRRHYINLKMAGWVRIINGAVSFVFRAIDKQNYYLIRITAPARGYGLIAVAVVDKGQERVLASRPINTFMDGWSTQDLEVEITVNNNQIDVKIADPFGEPNPFQANFKLEADTIRRGAPGIAARKEERAMIGKYTIEPLPVVNQ
jgi:hypothetical protein